MSTTTALLLKHLKVKSKSGFEWLCLCPYHEDNSPSFSVNIRKKLFICYACGAKGNMTQLLQHLGLSTDIEAEEISLDELSEKVRGVGADLSRTTRPPVGIPIPASAYSNDKAIHTYWNEERRLGNFAIQAYQLGYDNLNDEAIIPVRDFNGHTIGLIRRTFDPSRPRYLYSKGMKISEVVFGAHEAMKLAQRNKGMKGVLVVTEGAVDAMTVYNKRLINGNGQTYFVGVALLGARMSKTQAQIIKKMGFEEVIIATDMDRAGKLAQVQSVTMLKDIRAGAFIHKAEWSSELGKDLNALSEVEMMNALQRSRGDVYERLIKRQNNVSSTTTTATTGNVSKTIVHWNI